jgi:hypothetical protein
MKDACLNRLIYTIWLTRPFTPASVREAVIQSGCQGLILEGEIPGHRPEAVDWADVVFHLADIDIPKACVTNFAPFVHEDGTPWPELAKPLIDDGWACITENFITEAPNATPANTDWYAKKNLHWPETQPMVELWHLQDYGDLSKYRNVSHWDAGNLGTSSLARALSSIHPKKEAAEMLEWILTVDPYTP